MFARPAVNLRRLLLQCAHLAWGRRDSTALGRPTDPPLPQGVVGLSSNSILSSPDSTVFCKYNMTTWDPSKRELNLKTHGLDFHGCESIWDHFTVTREDQRQDYGEKRLVCFGLLGADVVVMVYTERPRGPHIISLRKAQKHEARYYRQIAKENLG